MKTQINFFIAFLLFMVSTNLLSQEYYNDIVIGPNTQMRTEYDAFNSTGQPIARTQPLAIIYIDFPDGRRSDNGNIPVTASDLDYVSNKDAIGEIGLTFETNNYPVTYCNASR